jgi:hypothetical protein
MVSSAEMTLISVLKGNEGNEGNEGRGWGEKGRGDRVKRLTIIERANHIAPLVPALFPDHTTMLTL